MDSIFRPLTLLTTEHYRKIGKRDNRIFRCPDDVSAIQKKFNFNGACRARAPALAIKARMPLVGGLKIESILPLSSGLSRLGFLFQNIDKKLLINPKHFLAPRRKGAKKPDFIFIL